MNVDVANGTLGDDYTVTARDVPEENKVVYDFVWDEEFPEKNPKATVSLKN